MTFLIDRFLVNGDESWAILKTKLGRALELLNDPMLEQECRGFQHLPISKEERTAQELARGKIDLIWAEIKGYEKQFKSEYTPTSNRHFLKIYEILVDLKAGDIGFSDAKAKINTIIIRIFEDYEGQ